ncbi:hypothetical protein [Mucilaginibacter lappiensis]|uniref:hypothetical protein n=1 Tax=Mucilaginibacter lappiensis TaxID=354630 RepID=UPI003D239AED
MKNFHGFFGKALLLLMLCAVLYSCKKIQSDVTPKKIKAVIGPRDTTRVITVIPAEGHTFSDIQVCYDGKVFLLENGKLKRLNGTGLMDVDVPAGFYADFNPLYLGISKDFTFYLRGFNGIKIFKGGQLLHFYKVGEPPLQNFTQQNFGSLEISPDEADQSIIFGTVRRGFDPILFSLYKITKDGQLGFIPFDETDQTPQSFMTCFATGAPGDLWNAGLGQFNDLYYGILYKNSLTDNPFTYSLTEGYGAMVGSVHESYPFEGPLTDVQLGVMGCIEISKDAKTMYLKTGAYHDGTGVSTLGNVFCIKNGIITKIAQNVENKRIAVTNDGKTLYLAGKGLTKLELNN